MAWHCPKCDFHTDDESAEACPTCFKPMLDEVEYERDYGDHVGNPGPWHNTLMNVNRLYTILYVLFAVAAIVFFARMFMKANP